MKKISLLVFVFAALAAVAPSRAQVSNDLIRILAQTKVGQERKDIRGATVDTVTQNVALLITLSGKPKNPDGRTGTYTFFGRDLEGKTVTTIETGTFPVQLSDTGEQKFESPAISTTSTAAHTIVERQNGGQNNQQNPRAKKVPASGVKYIGFSVVIKDGDKIVGEFYSQPSFKTAGQ